MHRLCVGRMLFAALMSCGRGSSRWDGVEGFETVRSSSLSPPASRRENSLTKRGIGPISNFPSRSERAGRARCALIHCGLRVAERRCAEHLAARCGLQRRPSCGRGPRLWRGEERFETARFSTFSACFAAGRGVAALAVCKTPCAKNSGTAGLEFFLPALKERAARDARPYAAGFGWQGGSARSIWRRG